MTIATSHSRALVVGGAGGVGSVISTKLAQEGFERVVALDIKFPKGLTINRESGIECVGADLNNLDDTTEELVGMSDLIILAVPHSIAIEFARKASSLIQASALLVDTLSVKSEYLELLEEQAPDAEVLSINPMFAPDLGFSGRSVLVVEAKPGSASQGFVDLLRRWGSKTVVLSADQHDHYTASLQVATHAALIAFGLALADIDYQIDKLRPLCPPPHHAMLAMLARIVGGEPETYAEIQRSNPYAKEIRQLLRKNLERLDQVAESGTDRDFAGITEEIQRILAPDDIELQAVCRDIFDSIAR